MTKTREEVIKKYWSKAKEKCPFNEETLQDGYLEGFIDGAAEVMQDNKWHDLRKFPADLPPQRERVFIADEYSKYHIDGVPTTAWRDRGCWMSMDDQVERPIGWKVYAWRKIPKIPEEYK